MKPDRELVVYWDASAVLSALFRDTHSADAIRWSQREAVHLLSSLAWVEVQAVIARLERERVIAEVLAAAARDALASGPWRRLHGSPDWDQAERLARRWPLRGADLWHLALCKTLQPDLPELVLLTFDGRLQAAAGGEGLA
ncbi:MAG TPA: type II toxin-antitoxin system VapC family toxin [Bacillota bacterium]